MNDENGRLDLDAAREKLRGKHGRAYWRSLEEVADTPEFQKWVDDEFPNRSTLMQINRRDMLKFMGASLALAGLSGCRGVFLPQDKIVPYVKAPEELVPGVPLYYSTSVELMGYGTGVLVEQHEGRPTKLEGNPGHPASLGALDYISQAEILNLYDPERLADVTVKGVPKQEGDITTWEQFTQEILPALQAGGIAVLTGAVGSPTLASQYDRFRSKFPEAKFYSYETFSKANERDGLGQVFGQPLEAVYDFARADVVVSIDSDFLSPTRNPGASLRNARDFAAKRRVQGRTGTMHRVYAFEPSPTLVGTMADHRWPVKEGDLAAVTALLGQAVGATVPAAELPAGLDAAQVQAVAEDLRTNAGAAVVVAGAHLPPAVHAMVALINATLRAPVRYIPPVDQMRASNTLENLVTDIRAGAVKTLLVMGGDPVFEAPRGLGLEEAFTLVPTSVYFGKDPNDTGFACKWELPESHALEQWGDTRAFDGTVGIQQPLIAPLFRSKSGIELLSVLLNDPRNGYDLVRSYWGVGDAGYGVSQIKLPGTGDFEGRWRDAVYEGFVANTAFAPSATAVNGSAASIQLPLAQTGMEMLFRPDPGLFDGRFANNGWLQELPNPINKVTWDNVAQVSPATAKSLGVTNDDIVTLAANGATVRAAIFIQPGQANDTVEVTVGYGRKRGGTVATVGSPDGSFLDDKVNASDGGGFDAYALRSNLSPYSTYGVEIRKTDAVNGVATTQGHNPLGGDRIDDDRDIYRQGTLAGFLAEPGNFEPEGAPTPEWIEKQNMYPEEIFVYDGAQWGMTIDLNLCTGCNACVTACQAENNIPVVGKIQVSRHREMHWLRIDRYYQGTEENPEVNWQPIMCVHCEKAPCEPVCPVAATVHSHEGLNQMIYNRCVGTRYCSNNCPYKVRRFNYLNYTDNQPNFTEKYKNVVFAGGNSSEPKKDGIPLLKMLNNPDVTVRGRGIMEKCTYCTQRISSARIEAKKEGRLIKDGDIVTACQQACPTNTIVFGNINDKGSQVNTWRNDPRAWLLLEELQTRPRTSHLARLRNPNPAITPAPAPAEAAS